MKSSDLHVTSNDVISSKEPEECVIVVNLVQAHLDTFLSFRGVNDYNSFSFSFSFGEKWMIRTWVSQTTKTRKMTRRKNVLILWVSEIEMVLVKICEFVTTNQYNEYSISHTLSWVWAHFYSFFFFSFRLILL